MRIAMDEYAYGYIKITVLKKLIMTQEELQKLGSFAELELLGNYIKRFYPGFKPKTHRLEDFESALWDIYFRIIEKILVSSPKTIQFFLKNYLIRFEIWNLKVLLLSLLKKSKIEKEDEKTLLYRPEKLLEREQLFKQLVGAKDIKEFTNLLEATPYKRIIERLLKDYEEKKEAFHLLQGLDRFYYTNLAASSRMFGDLEKNLLSGYIGMQIDFYNLRLIYRSLYNNIPLTMIRAYLVPAGLVLNKKRIEILMGCKYLEDFFKKLNILVENYRPYSIFIEILRKNDPNLYDYLTEQLLQIIEKKYHKEVIGNYELKTIMSVLELITIKELEIHKIMARAVQIHMAHITD